MAYTHDESSKGKYSVCQIAEIYGKGWGIENLAYNPPKLLDDWRKKGRKRQPWRGTLEEAQKIVKLLNTDKCYEKKITKDPISNSQLGSILKAQKLKTKQDKVSSFIKCHECGGMFKNEHTC